MEQEGTALTKEVGFAALRRDQARNSTTKITKDMKKG